MQRGGFQKFTIMLLGLMNVQKINVQICVSFYSPRGVEPYDNPTTVFVQRHEPQGDSSILSSTDFFQSEQNRRVILEKVDSFQLRDKYMFATTTRVRVHSNQNWAANVWRIICNFRLLYSKEGKNKQHWASVQKLKMWRVPRVRSVPNPAECLSCECE